MTPAERQITLEHLAWLKQEASRANASYDAARKRYKRQQRADRCDEIRTTKTNSTIDSQEALK